MSLLKSARICSLSTEKNKKITIHISNLIFLHSAKFAEHDFLFFLKLLFVQYNIVKIFFYIIPDKLWLASTLNEKCRFVWSSIY
ncbi:hypothetical protein XENTR_v10013389 [Xenopus tropicalis]|nr:hypothetical protein XENTR_v10013389 [Xenopus tropicalis]